MLKKIGMVGVGVTATMLAAAPFASACETSHHGDHDGDHGHHSVEHGSNNNTACAAKSGDVAGNHTKGILALGPIANGNAGQILSCNSFLNDNFSGNDLNIANGLSL